MFRETGLRLRLALIVVDLALTALALHGARLLRATLPFGIFLLEPLQFTPWFYVLVPVVWLVVFGVLRVYSPGRALRYAADLQSVWGATTMAMLVFTGIAYLFFRELSRLLLFYFYVLDLVLLTLGRWGLPRLVRRFDHLGPRRRVLVVGAGDVGRRVAEAIHQHRWASLELVGFVDDNPHKRLHPYLECPVLGGLQETSSVVRQKRVDEVIVALPSQLQREIEGLVLDLQALSVNVRLVPDVFSMVFIRASIEDLAGIPLIGLREPVISGLDRAVKRAFDVAIGALLLAAAAPAMALTALAIKIDSRGGAFFRQQRVGEDGRPFQMLKFRTMVAGAHEAERALAPVAVGHGPPPFGKRPDDPRVTPVGRFLRRWSLDELPQLVNVLRGDMSLVGPRPELPWLVEQYRPWQRKRFAVPQGMTGWWQVNGRSGRGDHDLRVEDDLYYIRNWSIWLDVRILWMTVGAVIRGEGAY